MSASQFVVEELSHAPADLQPIELVERKGKGHPDSICDAIAEQVSLSLCREYLATFSRILHHNADKALLVAGRTQPKPGGGQVLEPMRLVVGDRAVSQWAGKRLDVGGIAEASARQWLRDNLRFVDPALHLVFQNELKEGSPELTDIFAREVVGANDTSAAVGYAPLSETERLVLEAENWLNSTDTQRQFPEIGEDVKVMGVRRHRELFLTVAVALVDRFVVDVPTYFQRKDEIRETLTRHLAGKLQGLDRVTVQLNTLDDPERGESGVYLTVLGTSAEGGDCGQVGRGNRVNGLIPLNRPISNESAAGKNPISHVGKIYTLLSHHLANEVIGRVDGVAEIYIWLCSQIGQPIHTPLIAASQLILRDRVVLTDVQADVETILNEQLAGIYEFTDRLVQGEFPVC